MCKLVTLVLLPPVLGTCPSLAAVSASGSVRPEESGDPLLEAATWR